jgi:hypothetical protein
MPVFDKNSPIQHAANRLGATLWELSMRDYVVLRTTITPEGASIQIDRPLEGVSCEIKHHAEKTFGSAEFNGCRVFWQVQTTDQEAAA